MNRPPLPDALVATRLIAIARKLPPASLRSISAALQAGGVEVLEVTLDSPGALEALDELSRGRMVVGAGTVMSAREAREAIEAGAAFVVSPHLDAEIIAFCVRQDVPVVPGAFTPTEIVAAWQHGASAVKLFPASVGGPGYLRDLRGPLSHIPLIPTGGVTIESAPAYLAEGAVAVGLGSSLTGGNDTAAIAEKARRAIASCVPTGRAPPSTGDRPQ